MDAYVRGKRKDEEVPRFSILRSWGHPLCRFVPSLAGLLASGPGIVLSRCVMANQCAHRPGACGNVRRVSGYSLGELEGEMKKLTWAIWDLGSLMVIWAWVTRDVLLNNPALINWVFGFGALLMAIGGFTLGVLTIKGR